MNLSFINQLTESNQYRHLSVLEKTDAKTLANHAFIDIISLWILYNEFDYAPAAISYAQKTLRHSTFIRYQQASTDLYLVVYELISRKKKDNLPNKKDSIFLDRIDIDETKIKRFLRMIYANEAKDYHAKQFLLELEKALNISESNYRSIRRLSQTWGLLDNTQKSLILTRIIQFYKSHAPRSELYFLISKLSKHNGWVISDASDAEQKKSRSISASTKLAVIGGVAGLGYHAGKHFGKSLV